MNSRENRVKNPLVYTVKKNMKISVLLYICNQTGDRDVYDALIAEGFRVCRISNLSRLHTILESHVFDAIIVGSRFLELHGVKPARHLWETRSPHTIITWRRDTTEKMELSVHSIPDSAVGYARAPDREEKITRITSVLESPRRKKSESEAIERGFEGSGRPNECGTEATSERCDEVIESIFPEGELHIHRKMRLILNALVESGSRGIDSPSISRLVWENTNRDRTKDIQIYISKLRSLLSLARPSPYGIRFERKRYFLTRGKNIG